MKNLLPAALALLLPALSAGAQPAAAAPADLRDAMSGFAPMKKMVPPPNWIKIKGGTFTMVAGDGVTVIKSSRTVHVKDFFMAKELVTVEQYAECVESRACTAPASGAGHCYWGKPGREKFPVTCVTWTQAAQYARFKRARLPSEAEWEYAARSGGKNWAYPWGNDKRGTPHAEERPVCSDPRSNTKQGLCDMTGMVWQWVQDKYSPGYSLTPTDGSPYEGDGGYRIYRGGFHSDDSYRVVFRFNNYGDVDYHGQAQGLRMAK